MAYVKISVSPLQLFTEAKPPTRKSRSSLWTPFSIQGPFNPPKGLQCSMKELRGKEEDEEEEEEGFTAADESDTRWPAPAPAQKDILTLYLRLSITEQSHLGYQISGKLCSVKKCPFFYPCAIRGSYQFGGQFNCSFTLVQSFVKGRLSARLNNIVHSRPPRTCSTLNESLSDNTSENIIHTPELAHIKTLHSITWKPNTFVSVAGFSPQQHHHLYPHCHHHHHHHHNQRSARSPCQQAPTVSCTAICEGWMGQSSVTR